MSTQRIFLPRRIEVSEENFILQQLPRLLVSIFIPHCTRIALYCYMITPKHTLTLKPCSGPFFRNCNFQRAMQYCQLIVTSQLVTSLSGHEIKSRFATWDSSWDVIAPALINLVGRHLIMQHFSL